MATKEDILEQLVEEFLLHQGYFVRHNLKFLPARDHVDFVSNQDSNHSDIDVLGYHPGRTGVDRVVAVSCKSWQSGFNPAVELANIEQCKTVRGREAWKGFRELVSPKWSQAFLATIEKATGQTEFTYILAVTKVVGSRTPWESSLVFSQALNSNPIRIIDLRDMLKVIGPGLGTTLAGTEVGRMLQLFKAASVDISPPAL